MDDEWLFDFLFEGKEKGGLGDTADERQMIDGDLALLTKLQNPLAKRLSDGHSVPLVHGIGYCYGSGFV